MSVFIEAQQASVSAGFWRLRDFSRFSITSVRSPVSIALELATALRILAREAVTLPERFLRTIGRLQGKTIAEIITSPGHRALKIVLWVLAVLLGLPKLILELLSPASFWPKY